MNRYGVLQSGVTVLAKPFTEAEVLIAIRSMIDIVAGG
jgi:hypothetical protein